MRSALLVLALVLAFPVQAQPGWVRVAPAPGPSGWWFTGADGFLFGPGPGGLYRSADGGVSSSLVGAAVLPATTPEFGLNGVYARDGVVAVWYLNQADPFNGPAFFSRNGGETWTGGAVVQRTFVEDFAVIGDTLVFATVSEDLGTEFGPLRVVWSVDGGSTWVSQPLDENPISGEGQFSRSLFVDRGSLHAATTRGLYRASRGAEGWALVTDGDLGAGGGRLSLYDSATGDGAAYVATSGCSGFFPGVYRRLPEAANWTRIDVEDEVGATTAGCYNTRGLAASGDTVVAVISQVNGVVNPGVPTSFDGGATWEYVGAGLPVVPGRGVVATSAFSANGRLYVYATGCETPECYTDLYQLVPSLTVSTEPVPEPSIFRLWPNPVSETFTVDPSGTELFDARVIDMRGRVVRETQAALGRTIFDVRDLSSGVYIVQVVSAPQSVRSRLIVVY